jgi:hypothetical protein
VVILVASVMSNSASSSFTLSILKLWNLRDLTDRHLPGRSWSPSSINVNADIEELMECARRSEDDNCGLATALLSYGVPGGDVRCFHRKDGDGELKEPIASRSSESEKCDDAKKHEE